MLSPSWLTDLASDFIVVQVHQGSDVPRRWTRVLGLSRIGWLPRIRRLSRIAGRRYHRTDGRDRIGSRSSCGQLLHPIRSVDEILGKPDAVFDVVTASSPLPASVSVLVCPPAAISGPGIARTVRQITGAAGFGDRVGHTGARHRVYESRLSGPFKSTYREIKQERNQASHIEDVMRMSSG